MNQGIEPYLLVSGILFAIGFAGVVLRRNIIVIFMCLEMMLSAANLTLVAFSRHYATPLSTPDYQAHVLLFFIITVAAAEVAVVWPSLWRFSGPAAASTPIPFPR
ncbi:MAG: NADH-quinone oxidoreductase subunit NuoK [Verrucomicrobiales bacterium]